MRVRAGLGVHPHLFRHTFAHNLKAANMATEDVMMLGGWRDPGTVARYGQGPRPSVRSPRTLTWLPGTSSNHRR